MTKWSVLVCDEDQLYLERLCRYVRSGNLQDKFSVRTAATQEGLRIALQGAEADVLLASAPFLEMDIARKARLKVELVDGGKSGNLRRQDVPHIDKFTPADALFLKLQTLCQTGESRRNAKSGTSVTAVYSSAGGTGKTSIALNLCRMLTMRGKRVFYLNLESVDSSSARMVSRREGKFAQALYYLSHEQALWMQKIDEWLSRDGMWCCDYFPTNQKHALDMHQMSREQAIQFIDFLSDSGRFEEIIVDLESSFHPRMLGALARAETILWITHKQPGMSIRDSQQMRMLNYLLNPDESAGIAGSKSVHLLNKSVSPKQAEEPHIECLPYIPDWKHISTVRDWLAPDIFNGALMLAWEHREAAKKVI